MKSFLNYLSIISLITLAMSCESVPGTKRGNIAPDFKLKDIAEKVHSLSEYKGKAVMLHFWTDFCTSCRAEFPRIQEYYTELHGEEFELLAINVGQPINTSKEFKQSFDITFPMLADTQGIMKDIYKVDAFPTNYFIAPDGKVIRKIIGWVHKKQVREFIELYANDAQNTQAAISPAK